VACGANNSTQRSKDAEAQWGKAESVKFGAALHIALGLSRQSSDYFASLGLCAFAFELLLYLKTLRGLGLHRQR
jgi:hypothetical protein